MMDGFGIPASPDDPHSETEAEGRNAHLALICMDVAICGDLIRSVIASHLVSSCPCPCPSHLGHLVDVQMVRSPCVCTSGPLYF